MAQMKISVCIPVFNESKIIADTARTLSSYLEEHFGRRPDGSPDYEIVFSDDGSTDGSGDIVRSLGLDGVKGTGYGKNRGKGCAVRTAVLASEGDVVMFTDSDLAYGTDVIERFYSCLSAEGAPDAAVGSRNISKDGYEGYTFVRKAASKLYIKFLSAAGGLKLSDSQCGCKAFRAGPAKQIFSRCGVDGFAFDFEALLWADKLGFRVAELPVRVLVHGDSKVRLLRDSLKMLRDVSRMKKEIRKKNI